LINHALIYGIGLCLMVLYFVLMEVNTKDVKGGKETKSNTFRMVNNVIFLVSGGMLAFGGYRLYKHADGAAAMEAPIGDPGAGM